MKVTSLACIQGSWLPAIHPNSILDIGSGTGLLALMVAQKMSAHIDAIEIEDNAYEQLKENISKSTLITRSFYVRYILKGVFTIHVNYYILTCILFSPKKKLHPDE